LTAAEELAAAKKEASTAAQELAAAKAELAALKAAQTPPTPPAVKADPKTGKTVAV
jgi:hypothetical protein